MDSCIEFVYWSYDEWAKFIKESIIPLDLHAKKLLTFHSYLSRFKNIHISEVVKEWKGAEKALLGGINLLTNDSVEYNERGLANIYKELLGFSINIKEYFSYIKQGLEPEILCSTTDTTIINSIKDISNLTTKIIYLATSEGLIKEYEDNIEINDLIEKPESIVDSFYEFFFDKCIPITVGYNNYMNFVWSIRTITKKYLYLLYPELKDKEKLEAVMKILGLKTIFKPEVKDEKAREDYEILAFLDYKDSDREPSIGGLLCKLNKIIWDIFKYYYSYLALIAEPVLDLKDEYRKYVNEELDIKWSPLEIIKRLIPYQLSISGAVIKNYDVPLFIVLDNIMPAVSLGKYDIKFVSKDEFNIKENL